MNLNKEFVPYEIALELKELGFDDECIAIYTTYSTVTQKNYKKGPALSIVRQKSQFTQKAAIKAPLYQQAFRWFREKYNVSYSIDWMSRSSEFYNGYYVHFRGLNGNNINEENFIVLNDELTPEGYGVYKTHEEAELACLVKLIEIVKNK